MTAPTNQLPHSYSNALALSVINLFGFVVLPILIGVWMYLHPFYSVPVVTLYFTYVIVTSKHSNGGAPWESFTKTNILLTTLRKFFNVKLHLHEDLKPANMEENSQMIFGMHPHGCVSEFRIIIDGMLYDAFPNLKSWRSLAATVLFYIPFIREMALWTHCVDASRKSAQRALDEGHSLMIVPGGEHEQFIGKYQREILFLRKRKGFVRLALKQGIDIVPCYVFGNNDLYETSDFLYGPRFWLMKRFYICIVFFWGAYGLLGSPYRVPLHVVFGEPVKVKEPIPNPTPEQVDEAHAQYIDHLQKVFDENKAAFGYEDRELEIE